MMTRSTKVEATDDDESHGNLEARTPEDTLCLTVGIIKYMGREHRMRALDVVYFDWVMPPSSCAEGGLVG